MDGIVFVREIEALLAKKGIQKEVFYAESGISSATMSQYRSGIYDPSKRTIRKAVAYFGDDAAYLLDTNPKTDQKEKPSTVGGEPYGPAKQQLLDAVKYMTEQECSAMLALIQEFKNKEK